MTSKGANDESRYNTSFDIAFMIAQQVATVQNEMAILAKYMKIFDTPLTKENLAAFLSIRMNECKADEQKDSPLIAA